MESDLYEKWNKSARLGAQLGTVGIRMNANCLLKCMSTEHNKYVVNQILDHFKDVHFFYSMRFCAILEHDILCHSRT
jgi:hypothetical protein